VIVETERRLVGIDLGIASSHTVRVLTGDGSEVCRRRCEPTAASLAMVAAAALAGAPAGTGLEVIMEPTGPAWLPVAVYFLQRGHRVYRVSSAKASALRRFLSRHAKSNGIDADTLARLPLMDPAGLQPLELPEAARAELERRVRATDRLTQEAATHKVRLKDFVRQLLPMTPLRGDLCRADLAVLERTGGHPDRILGLGRRRLTAIIVGASNDHLGAERADDWLESATRSSELYAKHAAFAADALADDVLTELRLLTAIEGELARHAAARERAYCAVDSKQLARSLPGVSTIGAPALVALMGRPGRFEHGDQFRSYSGLAPRASETGDTDRKGQVMSKAGPGLLRTTLVRAADTARKQDPQLARVYHAQMTERGAPHIKALCVVAAHLAERSLLVMKRGTAYVVRDVDGTQVSPEEAKVIIATRYTVTEEQRARRRSKKTRKAPQKVLEAHVEARRPPSPVMVTDRGAVASAVGTARAS
jgi:transposase